MPISDEDIRDALAGCASEPVHIPGTVQPFSCLVALDVGTWQVTHVSENCEAFLGQRPETLLTAELSEIIGRTAWHGLKNTLSLNDVHTHLLPVGAFEINDRLLMLHAYQDGQTVIVEFEQPQDIGITDTEALKTLTFLMQSIETCTTETELFEVTVRLMRNLTRYDRVMVYRFDEEFNGVVLAESCRKSMESFMGLRFPHWDIPEQARAMMLKSPIRVIQDVDLTPVPLLAADTETGPLDISLAASRGVSPIHMEYLRNMGVQSSLTLTIKLDGALWGIISFHHMRPGVPAAALRDVLTQFGRVFSTKLLVLRQKDRLDLGARVDDLKDEVASKIESEEEFDTFASAILDILNADGVAIGYKDGYRTKGLTPEEPVLAQLRSVAELEEKTFHCNSLIQQFPTFSNALNDCAGALVATSGDRTFFVFRKEAAQEVNWAGNPEKSIENHEGQNRISPRGSFSTYLSMVTGYADPWSDQDQYFAHRIWSLLNSVERRELINKMARQQKIMISELNHRVRNILALIRSVSQQARRSSYGSLESYSESLEARIHALAASHDLASSILTGTVPLRTLITKEFEPYEGHQERVSISGEGKPLRVEVAPIFSLVVHELVTNAVKYGALSNDTGRVDVALIETDAGIDITWQEVGGSAYIVPESFGFGTTLIRQAIPYELNGEADLRFESSGVMARFHLPDEIFEDLNVEEGGDDHAGLQAVEKSETVEALLSDATCWIVEDNFVIAEGMRLQIEKLGVTDVEVFSSAQAALDSIEEERPTFAVLDFNLGRGHTSEPFAERLFELGVPFLFVTGYGESIDLDKKYADIRKLTKPVSNDDLLAGMTELVSKKTEAPA